MPGVEGNKLRVNRVDVLTALLLGRWRPRREWYVDSSGREAVLRSTSCARASRPGLTTCSACIQLFVKGCLRSVFKRLKANEYEMKNPRHMGDEQRRKRDQKIHRGAAALDKKLAKLREKLAMIKGPTVGGACSEMVRRGMVKEALRLLEAAHESDKVDGLETFGETAAGDATVMAVQTNPGALVHERLPLAFVVDVVKHMTRKRNGAVVEPALKSFMMGLRIMGGESSYNYVAMNLGLATDRTARKWVNADQGQQEGVFQHGLVPTNFKLICAIYASMRRADPSLRSTLVAVAEDETGVKQEWRWDNRFDELIGGCGRLCNAKCATKPACTKKGCLDTHACSLTGYNATHVVGETAEAYENLLAFVDQSRLATNLRVLLINPLNSRYPVLPCVMMATCNTFDFENYVKRQWGAIRDMYYDAGLGEELGPLVTHGSDGDSRRRLGMMRESLYQPTEANRESMTLAGAEGFTYTAFERVPGRALLAVADQDYIHGAKKVINAIASPGRTARIGLDGGAALSFLRPMVFDPASRGHGIRRGDLARTGYDAMDWPSAHRLLTRAALRAMEAYEPQAPAIKGTRRILSVMRTFVSIFLDDTLSHEERVARAGEVTTILRLWRGWIISRDDLTLKENFITREGMQDAILACHNVVLLMMIARESLPDSPIDFKRLGSDCCETFFSSLGSFVMNKRTYSTMEALESVRSMLTLLRLEAQGHMQLPKKQRKRKQKWDPGSGDSDGSSRARLHEAWPENEALRCAWNEGCKRARVLATEWGMKPRPGRSGGALPEWWRVPQSNDPPRPGRADGGGGGGVGRSEEDLIEDEAASDGDDADSGDGDDEGDDSTDEDSDDNDDSDDDDEPLVPLSRILVMMAARGQPGGVAVKEKMPYPGVEGGKSKRAVIAMFNEEKPKLSADRGLRVKQARPGHGRAEVEPFDISSDDWLMGVGTDVAVNHEKNIFIGRVIKMRKKGKSRGHVEYGRPVVLHRDRGQPQQRGLQIQCSWYKRKVGGGGKEDRYVINKRADDWEWMDIDTVTCPVSLTYNESGKYYVMDPQTAKVLRAQKSGASTVDL